MFRTGLFRLSIPPDHRIRGNWLRKTLDLYLPALLAVHIVLYQRVGLE